MNRWIRIAAIGTIIFLISLVISLESVYQWDEYGYAVPICIFGTINTVIGISMQK